MFLENALDWTTKIKQSNVVEISNSIVEKIINEINLTKPEIYKKNNFTKEELNLLIRWPIYVSVNTFIDRLLTILYNKNIYFDTEHKQKDFFRYYEDTNNSITSYYNNYNLNKFILFKINEILNKDNNLNNYPKNINIFKYKEIVNEIEKIKKSKLKKGFFTRFFIFIKKNLEKNLMKSYSDTNEFQKFILLKIYNFLNKNLYKIKEDIDFKSFENRNKIINNISVKKAKKIFLLRVIDFFIRNFEFYTYNFLQSIFKKFYINNIIYEGDRWFKPIYPLSSKFPEFKKKQYKEFKEVRKNLRNCFQNVFLESLNKSNFKINKKYEIKIAHLFSIWIDHSLSYAIIEGLNERVNFYKKILNKYKINEIHTCTGFYYNDNFKIFSILAKRRNAKLIAQDDGVDNFLDFFPNKNIPNQYKGLNQIMLVDYYCAWGKGKLFDGYKKVEKKYKTKVFNVGSVYMSKLNKWNKKIINKEKFTVLYPSGPLRNFMATLEEISPQKNLFHKKKVLLFLKKLLDKYPGMKLLYKSFMLTGLEFDPIIDILPREFSEGRVEISYDLPVNLIPKVDIVFFDMVSTGFAEAINMEAPTLVYHNIFNYNLASPYGKKVNQMFEKSKSLFYDDNNGIKATDYLINQLDSYNKINKKPRNIFIKELAFPVNKNQFKRNIKNMII